MKIYFKLIVIIVFLLVILVFCTNKCDNYKNKDYSNNYKCFLLTLPDSHERRSNFLRSYNINNKKNIKLEIVNGIKTKSVEEIKKFEDKIDHVYLNKAIEMLKNPSVKRPDITYFNIGAIGCYFGHLDIYDRCIKENLKYALIFEDNVIIKSNKLFNEINKYIEKKGDDFEACFFHCWNKTIVSKNKIDYKIKWIQSTKCYLINVNNIKKYINYFIPMNNHIDQKYEDLISNGARVYYKNLHKYITFDFSKKSTINHSPIE